jgi:hypothetical protein
LRFCKKRKFTCSLFVCKQQATVAGEGDRKSNEALELPQPPHRMTSKKLEQLAPKMDPLLVKLQPKDLPALQSVQISTFGAYIQPPYIVIGLVIPIMLTVIWKNQWEGIFLILKNWDHQL